MLRFPQALRPMPQPTVGIGVPPHAEIIVERIAEAFRAPTLLLDGNGTVVASSIPEFVGQPFSHLEYEACRPAFRSSFCHASRTGEVVVCKLANGERISPRIANVLLDLLLDDLTGRRLIPTHNELKNRFIYDLLHDRLEDEAAIHYYAELLRLDLTLPRSVILINAAGYVLGNADEDSLSSGQVQRRAQFIIDAIVRFFHLSDDLICAYLGNGRVGVLKASDSENLAAWTEQDPTKKSSGGWADLAALKRASHALLDCLPSVARSTNIGIGRYHPGIRGLARSFADAQMALSLGQRFNQERRIHCLDELGIAAFVGISQKETKLELAEHLLNPLDDEPELLETLQCYFATNCNNSVTSSQLYVHRNTLSYRLDKIAKLTGLDPRNLDDAIQIRLAMVMRTLYTD